MSEATEEAILNAMCQAETLVGWQGRKAEALPLDRVKEMLGKFMVDVEKGEIGEVERGYL